MVRLARYSKDEHARRGKEVYEQLIRRQVEQENRGRIVAIDIESGEFELGDNTLAASEKLLARAPDAQIWCVRIGEPGVHQFSQRGNIEES